MQYIKTFKSILEKKLFILYKKLAVFFIYIHAEKLPFVVNIHRLIYKLFKPKFVSVLGMKLYVNPNDKVLSDILIRDRIWEKVETNFVLNYIKKNWVVFDIGANIGYYTLLFSKLVGKKGKVIAFEPDFENFSFLKLNISKNKLKNVLPVQKAVSTKTGNIKLYLDEENKGDHKIYNSYDSRKSVNINSISLDNYYRGRADLIKMDIQGAEYLALTGMLKLLKKQDDITIITEYWPMGLYKAGAKPQKYIHLLKDVGFRLFFLNEKTGKLTKLNEKKLHKDCTVENKNYANLICIKSAKEYPIKYTN